MTIFYYNALNANNEIVSGTIEALSPRDAREKIRAMGLMPTTVKTNNNPEIKETHTLQKSNITHLSLDEKQRFLSELQVMLSSGISTLEALTVIIKGNVTNHIKIIATDISEQIKHGSTFSDAIKCYENIFGHVCITLCISGEATGTLPITLQRMIGILKKQNDLKQKIINVSIYPVCLVAIVIAMYLFFGGFAFPNIVDSLSISEDKIPVLCKMVMTSAKFILKFWYLFVILLFLFWKWIISKWQESKFKIMFDDILLKIPVIHDFVLFINLSSLFSILHVAYEAGMPIPDILAMAKNSISNNNIKNSVNKATDILSHGIPFSEALTSVNLLPETYITMLRTGEVSGNSGEMFKNIASEFDKKVDEVIGIMAQLFQPILTTIIGIFVAIMAIFIIQMYFTSLNSF